MGRGRPEKTMDKSEILETMLYAIENEESEWKRRETKTKILACKLATYYKKELPDHSMEDVEKWIESATRSNEIKEMIFSVMGKSISILNRMIANLEQKYEQQID